MYKRDYSFHSITLCVSGLVRGSKGCCWDSHFSFLLLQPSTLLLLLLLLLLFEWSAIYFPSSTKHCLDHAIAWICVMINEFQGSVLTFQQNKDADVIYWPFCVFVINFRRFFHTWPKIDYYYFFALFCLEIMKNIYLSL